MAANLGNTQYTKDSWEFTQQEAPGRFCCISITWHNTLNHLVHWDKTQFRIQIYFRYGVYSLIYSTKVQIKTSKYKKANFFQKLKKKIIIRLPKCKDTFELQGLFSQSQSFTKHWIKYFDQTNPILDDDKVSSEI